MPAGLSILSGTQTITVPSDRPFVVGRATAADLVVADNRVSRRHLLVEPTPDGWAAVDLSANGTWQAGRRVRRVDLRAETRFHLGAADGPHVTLVPEQAGGDEPPVTTALDPGGLLGRLDGHDASATDAHHELRTLFPGALGEVSGPVLPAGRRGGDSQTTDPAGGRVHPLAQGVTTIGRSTANTIVVDDLLASRRHAELFVGQSGITIVDLGSANGTFVNGRRVDRAGLVPGDLVAVGHHVFHVADDQLVEYLDSGDVAFEVDGLSVDAGEARLLHDITFRLPGRALLAVIGPSGAGKSTLLNALTGVRPANVGAVRYAGRDLYADYDELRHRIGYVPQDDILHTSLTVRQALEYGAKLRFPAETTSQERGARVDAVLAELGLTNAPADANAGDGQEAPAGPGAGPAGGDLADRRVSKLSGGQRKRTSVALELLTQPTLLYLDEPTSGLDPGLDLEVMESLRRLADDGRTVIVVTHSVAQLDLCDYVLVLAKGGHIAYFGPPQRALSFLGAATWSEAFRVLKSGEGAGELARRYRASDYFVRGSARVPSTRPKPAALPSIRQQSVLSQALTLSRRYLRVIAADPAHLRLLIGYPFVLGLIPRIIDAPFGLHATPTGQPNREATLVLLMLILNACLMGASAGIREIVKEREIYRRERAVGLSTVAYLASKVGVLAMITGVQGVAFTTVATIGRGPADGTLSGFPTLELMAAVTGVAMASAMAGLLISALVDSTDKAMPLLALLTMAQLVFSGSLVRLAGRVGLEQVSYLFPARWAYAAAASVTDLVGIQRLGDERVSPGTVADPVWEHSAMAFTVDLAGLCCVGLLLVALTYARLRRLDPRTAGRRR
ncbi:ATP-binding cassette domain-containing protein [Frankia sp. CNm7]|uniref:FHA domain-containing protein n=1 Tax=Frankia nepalensis TaxID=1836974 RepID=UPI0019347C6B|nr:FHA domain-containing protein [Frankia nepalensis]MBL7498202.1 ATP-binding cassette domain-containing protein [Frankia nepalensis]MBL7513948.1 ATP-binding cassette domain-containing protein [Frankia nepalensis]MBL7522232.1 ATP-binding cassette domain-containing protein [Frankia nepalensis]